MNALDTSSLPTAIGHPGKNNWGHLEQWFPLNHLTKELHALYSR